MNTDIFYERSNYIYGNGISITMWSRLEGPLCDCTINLIDYNLQPAENHVFIPKYKMGEEYLTKFIEDFRKPDSVLKVGWFGPWNCEYYDMELRDDWQNVAVDLQPLQEFDYE